MKFRNFLGELRRRNVYKVAVAHAVVASLLIQAASILYLAFGAPGWVMKVFVTIVAAGFPIALIIAWAFEMTPEGMKRTESVSPDKFIPQWSRRKFALLIINVALVADYPGHLVCAFAASTIALGSLFGAFIPPSSRTSRPDAQDRPRDFNFAVLTREISSHFSFRFRPLRRQAHVADVGENTANEKAKPFLQTAFCSPGI